MTAKKERIHILIADDHSVVREGLVSLVKRKPDMKVVAEASTLLQPKLQALEERTRAALGAAVGARPAASAPKATAPAPKPAARAASK